MVEPLQSDEPILESEIADPAAAMRGANRRQSFGGRRAGEYTHWIKEQMSWKETCYIGDWTFLANCLLEGPDAVDLLADLSINSFADYPVGGMKHLVQCNEDGKVITDGVLLRHGEEQFELHGVPSYWTEYNRQVGDYDATTQFRDTFNYQVQGPTALDVLENVTEGSLRDIDFAHFGEVEIAGHPINAVRFGMAGEIGFELQGDIEYAQDVWDTIYREGQEFGVQRLSVKTSAINQLEAGIPTRIRDYVSAIFGDEMADYRDWLRENAHRNLITHPVEGSFDADDISAWYRTPVELNWDHYMKFDHDFLGSEALKAEAENPTRRTVTLEWDTDDVVDVYASLYHGGDHYSHYKYMDMPHQQKRAMVADRVLADGEDVGVATMRGYSYFFGKTLSLATIDVEHAEPGTEVTVLWGEGGDPVSPTVEPHQQKEVSATVAPTPYKEDRRRTDLKSAED